MKKPHVLNRPMFNTGGTSAYGKGITYNLVSDEQRRRFNYGGRVGLKEGLMAPFYNPTPWDELPGRTPITTSNTYEVEDLLSEEGDIIAGGDKEYYDIFPSLFKGRRDIAAEKEKTALPPQLTSDMGGETFVAEKDVTNLGAAGTGELPTDKSSDVIDWTEFAEELYDKKSAKGQALLGLAGNVLAASQQPKKEAAAILGKGMGEFGKTWASRKEKMEDIAATGKMYEKVNVAKAAEAGKWAVAAEKIKQGILNSDTAIYNKAALKNNKPKEGLEAVLKFDIVAAPTKDGVLDVEAFTAKGEGQVGQYGGQFVLTIEDGEILGPAPADDIQEAYSAWKARKKLANSPTS